MFGQPDPWVAIAGDGVAASAMACLLLDDGFGVVLTGGPRRAVPGVIEALPESTVRLLAEVGLGAALAGAGAVAVEGFDNRYGGEPGRRLEGRWSHVDRHRLAGQCLMEARRRGATLVPSDVSVGAASGAFALVDATGRAARWSRPVARSGPGAAAVYSGPGRATARPGCIVRTQEGWAYRLDHPDTTTVGVVAGPRAWRALTDELADRLDIGDGTAFVRAGSQSAGVQWSRRCIGEGRLAIGDAALAYSPLAGQGVRFAVSSALAAAATLCSWRDGHRSVATAYYESFVAGARDRHLAKLAALDVDAVAPEPFDLGRRLSFVATVAPMGMNVAGRIVTDEGCVLADGGLLRWAGGFDLLLLRNAVAGGRSGAEVAAVLVAAGMSLDEATTALAWAFRVGLLAYEGSLVATR